MEHIINFCVEKNIKQINLEVSSNNTTAINLYQNCGFQEVGLRKNYYGKYDGILFTKFIKTSHKKDNYH
ncbi:MAG: GNAT family N-acetyltransferase [Clostridia bacterium]|nr:GNAT family N-acetyltransferase [Clostridia bacterium]